MKNFVRHSLFSSAVFAGLNLFALSTQAAAQESAATAPGVSVSRLSGEQFKLSIAQIFGPDIQIAGRFEPDVRQDGLRAIGASRVSVTASGLEQFDSMARSIAAQVVDKNHRGTLIGCTPASETAPDKACASQFLAKTGRLLFRRPLSSQELAHWVDGAGVAAKSLNSFYDGLATSLANMMISPQFLFRLERVGKAGTSLDAFSKASRLSFFLWNATPDSALLTAAEKGELDTQEGLQRQVERMLASARMENGIRALFDDMFGFEEFNTLAKDATIYPKFTPLVSDDGHEQTLRTIVDHVVRQDADYRDLFTTRKTFLTPLLGAVYGVPVAKTTPLGAPATWQAYEYPEGDPRAGILTHISFVALHSHPGRTSPTLRGKALRELIMCQKVPDPPGNVEFNLVQDTNNPNMKTVRERLAAHATEAMCAGCHRITDPIGLALEHFDSSGGYRTTENGAAIDASGDISGAKFTNSIELANVVRANPAVTSCAVKRTWAYAVGRPQAPTDNEAVKTFEKNFADQGYRFLALMRSIATSDAFYKVEAKTRKASIDLPIKTAAAILSP